MRFKKKARYKSNKYGVWITLALGIFTVALSLMFIFIIIGGGKNSKQYNVKLNNYTYYSVSLGKYESLDAANIEAEKVIIRGGAGHVAEYKGFNVLASLYINKSDAEKVVQSLKKSDINAEIFIIEIPKINIKSSFDYSGFLNNLLDPLGTLCDLYFGLDGGSLSLINAQGELNKIVKTLNTSLMSFEKQCEGNLKDIRIKAEFKVISNYMVSLQTFENIDALSLKIKQTQFKILYGIIDLFKEISD